MTDGIINSSTARAQHSFYKRYFKRSEKFAFTASQTSVDPSSHPLLGMMRAKCQTEFAGLGAGKIRFAILALLILIAAGTYASTGKTEAANPSIINRNLRQILSQPEYNRVYPKDTTPKWWKQFLDKAGNFITNVLKWLLGSLSLHSEQAGRLTSFVFACLVVMAFFALLALIISRISRRIRASVESSAELAAGDYDIPSSRLLTSEAAKLADAGDWRGAFRCVYLASISHLDETGALRFERSRTNREYLRELDKNGKETLRDQLRPLVTNFDRKFYGRERCDKADYLNALAVYERIKGEAAA
jgi:hypothetical protein